MKRNFFVIMITVMNLGVFVSTSAASPPYPPSPVIPGVQWAPPSEIIRLAKGCDNWPLTWADDGHLYAAYGDGNGFRPFLSQKLSMGFAKIIGSPPHFRGKNIRSKTGETVGDGARGKKASGLLMVDGVLYLWARNAGNSQLAWSTDHAKTWTWSDWTFTESFGCPTFLNFGRNYTGSRDKYVYIYSPDSNSAYQAADHMVLARVHRKKIRDRSAYEFFQRLDGNQKPVWTKQIERRGAVFTHASQCYRSGISYNPGLKRYLWCQTLPGDAPRFKGGFGIYDAPEPWGPWSTVFFTEKWDVGPGETCSIPTKWISTDGRTAYLVFSGDDAFSVRQVVFGDAKRIINHSVFPDENWLEASPESQGMDSSKLQAAVGYLKSRAGKDGVHELVIVRNGYLVWKGDRIDKVHGVWSLTKSFTSTVLGLLIDEGITSLDTPAWQYLPALKTTFPTITLRHFTTMTSGYRAQGDEARGGYKHGPSRTPFLPDKNPLFSPPGSTYAYWDSAMNQFANVLTRIAGEPLEDYFKRKIADPIGMHREKWHWGNFGKIDGLVVNGGSGNNNKHIFICARELARFGLLFLHRGKWKEKQLISSSWVDESHQNHVPASLALHPLTGADGRGTYGFNWWMNGIKPDGKRKWPDAPSGTYAASGYNNNDMFIIPEWNMVIVRLGLDQQDQFISDEVYSTFLKKTRTSLQKKTK